MQEHPTTPHQGIRSRLRAAFSALLTTTPVQMSQRLPDLETWKMPHRVVDMQDWTVAINMANNPLNPDRTKLVDLIESLLTDAHLASTMESRVLRVMRSKYKLVDAQGQAKPELLALFEQPWFEDFLRYTTEAEFRGHTVIMIDELLKPGQVKSIVRLDQRNVLPHAGMVLRKRGDTTGYNYREGKLKPYCIEVGRPEELGILAHVAPVVVVKKYAIGSWSDYVHKYGIPPRWVKTRSTDKTRVRQLEDVMQQMVSSAYAVIGGDEEIQVMQTPGTDAHKVFDELISRMNSEISKRVLGQDGTSDNKDASGTFGSLKVLQGVAEDRHQADKASVRYVINNELLPRLAELGYPLAGVTFQWDELRDLGPMELVDAVQKLGSVFEIDPKYMEERTGIKIIGIKRAPGEVSDNPGGTGRQSGKKKGEGAGTGELPDDPEEEDGPQASWPRRHNPRCGVCGGHQGVVALGDALSVDAIDALLDAAFKGENWSNPYFTELGMRYREGLLNTWGREMGSLSYDAVDHGAAAAMELNMFRFSAAKTSAALVQLNSLVKKSTTFADFKRSAEVAGVLEDYNRRWLETEYQHAVNVGMQSSRYHQLVRDSEAFPYWEYYTQGDAQVRPTHAALDRKVFAANDPIWNSIYPPNGWGCRCTVLPLPFAPEKVYGTEEGMNILRGADGADYKRMQDGGWLVNRSKLETVFDLASAYRKELKAGDSPRSFRFGVKQSYGRGDMDFESLKSRGLPVRIQTLQSNGDAQMWFTATAQAQTKEGMPVMVMRDHMGRQVHITKSYFDAHLQGDHRSTRYQVANLMPDVLAKPDEVWVSQGEREENGMNYVKFYEQGIMRVSVVADGSGLRVTTWTGDWSDQLRSGLLIKSHQ